MIFPRNNGDKKIFREDFISSDLLEDNGGSLSNATVSNGSMVCTAGGADYDAVLLDSFLAVGGTLRFKVNFASGGGTAVQRMVSYSKDSNYSLTLGWRSSDGFIFFQIQNGAGNNYYTLLLNRSANLDADTEFVITWSPSTTTLTGYVNGALMGSNAVAGTVILSPEPATQVLRLGRSGVSPFTGTFLGEFEIFQGIVWGVAEVLLAYNKTTYSDIDYGKAPLYLQMKSRYASGGVQVTENKGYANLTVQVGDGTTSTTFPSVLYPRGFNFDSGDYLEIADSDELDFGDGQDFAFSFGFKGMVDSGAAETIFQKIKNDAAGMGSVGNFGYDMLLRADQAGDFISFRSRDADDQTSVLTSTITGVNDFHTCIVSADRTAATLFMYIDGELNNSVSHATIDDLTNNGKFLVNMGVSGNSMQLFELTAWRTHITPRRAAFLHSRIINDIKR